MIWRNQEKRNQEKGSGAAGAIKCNSCMIWRNQEKRNQEKGSGAAIAV